jgi:hypothetical protein
MTPRPRLSLQAAALFIACASAGLWACGAQEGAPHPAALRGAIRPTDGTGWNGNGYGAVPVSSHDSPGGGFRVFYTLVGESAVDPADTSPKDGVPDFVQQVAIAADRTLVRTVQAGFRAPLDDSVYHDRPDYGGDGRFDIYLRKVGAGSDGYRVQEVCTDVPYTCAGYFVMTPIFRGSSYKSDQEGIEVLTSHELFHAIQDAYDARQWRTWTEGTATWNEMQVYPETTRRDFTGFLHYFLDAPERPFDLSMGSGPGDLYPYGAALWAQFLGERFGAGIIREIWQKCQATARGRSPHFLDATDQVLRDRHESDLGQAWLAFTRWNALTGARAFAGMGYKDAADYPEVRLEDGVRGLGETTVTLGGLSARYVVFDPALQQGKRLRLLLVDESDTPATGTAYLLKGGRPKQELPFPSGKLDVDVAAGERLLVVASGVMRGAPMHPVTLRLAEAPAPPPPVDMGGAAGCAVAPPGSGGPRDLDLGLGALLGGLCALLRLRRRPRALPPR